MRGIVEEPHARRGARQRLERLEDVGLADALATGHAQLGELEHGGRLAPDGQAEGLVGAHDEGQLVAWVSLMQALQGIDREEGPGRSASMRRDLDPRARGGEPAQLQPVLDARLVLELLVRRRVDGEQQHAVEPEPRQRLLRTHHVSHVRRVEDPPRRPIRLRAAPGRRPRPGT